MWKKRVIFVAIAALLIFLTACGSENPENVKHPENSMPSDVKEDDYKEIITPNNELGFKLFQQVKPDDEGNVFISPTSLFMALGMVYNGAGGETKEEMARTLQMEGIDANHLNKASASLMNLLQKDSEFIELAIANSIWLNEEFHFQQDFAKNNQDYFGAKIEEIDVHDAASATRINEWVEDATNGKIEKMVDAPLNSKLVTYLLNAIYFKGDWTYPFQEKATEPRDFHMKDGNTKEVSMMTLTEDLRYMENDLFQAVELPYGEETMKMQVYLPKEAADREAFRKELTIENWKSWDKEFEVEKGTVNLPKFKLNYEILLNEVLQQFGMKSAFDEEATFTKIIEEDVPVWISSVKQKTFIEVHEKGTEAAAATGVEMVKESAPLNEPFLIEVDHPFVVMIIDDETDAVLFIGEIANPEE